ncbi:hypothetical protein [Sorangium sp. So ce124]|uniref:hypothetical protein n=1 Tax=Sorangium sp. So ce124 TaxID=3133280 RepID=UPI003F5E2D28
MRQFASHIPRFITLTFALCSIGAETSKCTPDSSQNSQETQPSQDFSKPFCHTDPPINCVVFCYATDQLMFTPACNGVGADELTLLFMEEILISAEDLAADGIQVCPAPDPNNWLTPCDIGIIPQEWPNQDHAACRPVPPGCAW